MMLLYDLFKAQLYNLYIMLKTRLVTFVEKVNLSFIICSVA